MPTPAQHSQAAQAPADVIRYDGVLRMLVPSRRPGKLPYLVDLAGYGGNGRCCCPHFTMRLEPFLRSGSGVSACEAADEGLVKEPVWGTAHDSLRCRHIHAARLHFADDVIQAIAANQP